MDTNKYLLFLKIAECRNLTTAARAMNYTQSAASYAIDSLEKMLGLNLLQRTHAGTELTLDGNVLLPAIRDLIECEKRIHALAKSIITLQTGDLKIGSFTTLLVTFLPGVLRIFHERYPNIRLEIYSGNGGYRDVERALQGGLVDCSFTCRPVSSDLHCIDLFDDPFLAVLPPNHHLAGAEGPIQLEQLIDTPFLTFPSNNNFDFAYIQEHYQFNPRSLLTLPDSHSMLAMADAGLGCTILPQMFLKSSHYRAAVKEIAGHPKRTICFAYRATENMSPRVKALLSIVQTTLEEDA